MLLAKLLKLFIMLEIAMLYCHLPSQRMSSSQRMYSVVNSKLATNVTVPLGAAHMPQ